MSTASEAATKASSALSGNSKRALVSRPVHGEFVDSRSDRCLVQPSTMRLPPVRVEA